MCIRDRNIDKIVIAFFTIIGVLAGFVVSWRTIKTDVKELKKWRTDYSESDHNCLAELKGVVSDKEDEIANLREQLNRLELDNQYNKEYTNRKLEDIFNTIAEVNRTLRQ